MEQTNRERINAYLVARRADQFAFLTEIVKVPSENPPGETTAIRERLVDAMAALELTPDVLKVETESAGEAADLRNLIVRREFGDGPTLALSAHVDTAPVGQRWTRQPFAAAIEDGRLYGRGASDGKGDLAAYVFALLALEEISGDLAGAVELHVTFDGFGGGELGPRWLLESGATQPDWVIVPGRAGAVGTATTGVLNLDVEIRGWLAPAGNPSAGADALEGAAHVLTALYAHRDELRARLSETEGIGAP
ncbi:MAG: M20/M25/M40 family metallo-hydrolase, partial [Magnetovibrio sp.]|nr:M20/M25/M40 family metallo-hydrolase [Magnetovibrio sp.]